MTTFSAFKEEFGGTSERLQRYVADITKGWVIVVVGGLCTSVIVAMVTPPPALDSLEFIVLRSGW